MSEVSLENLRLDQLPLREIYEIDEGMLQKIVRVRGFVGTKRGRSNFIFVVLRDQLDTIQCFVSKKETQFEEGLTEKSIITETYIEVIGKIVAVNSPIIGCTKKNFELHASSLKIMGKVYDTLPFSLKDAAASKEEREANPSLAQVSYSLRLDNRFLDFRIPSTQAILRVVDGTMGLFREYLRSRKFMEIKTTKIIESGSEGGANLFSMNYFGKTAYLAQSPQLYKQMAILGGLKRVYEIGHVYRAEESNINRYLSEFTGVDLEMEINGTYEDTIAFIYKMFVFIFDSLKKEYTHELKVIRNYNNFTDITYSQEPVIISYVEAIKLLNEASVDISVGEDFSRDNEKKLGEIVKKVHEVDFFVIKNYPKKVRAFYTYYDKGSDFSHSYDFILRGEEILSGAERMSDSARLIEAIKERNIDSEKPIKLESLKFYIDAFKYGSPPHAGCGIGLERLLKAYLGFDDIRYFSLFPRDPKRLTP